MVKQAVLYLAAVVAIAAAVQAKAVVSESEPQKIVASNINDFANDFYQQLAKSRSGNSVSSPLSVAMVLALLAHGAAGSTAAQLRSALHQSADDATTKQGFQSLIEALNEPGKVDVRLANKIFVDKRITLKKEYQQLTEEVFKSEIQNVDFSKTAKAAKIVNDWAAANTADKIQDLVSADDVNGAVAVLANAVYFKGAWRTAFNKKSTKKLDFHVNSRKTEKVDTMVVQNTFNYGTVPGVKAHYVELPYENGFNSKNQYSMIVVIPDEIDGLAGVEANLKNVKFSALGGHYEKLQLFLPKFKVESEFDLEKTLAQLGVTEIFKQSANFKNLSEVPLVISKFVQKAYINVDENGTEAAAATAGIGMVTAPMVPVPPVPVKVDRPFYYAIVYGESKNVLFQGRVTSPKV